VAEQSNNVKPLFRDNALNSLNTLDDVNNALTVVMPGSWLLIAVSMLTVTGILLWAYFGRVSINVEANGILLPFDQIHETEKHVKEMMADRINKLNFLKELLDRKKQLYNKHYLSEVDFHNAENEYLTAKAELTTLPKSDYFNTQLFTVRTGISNTVLDALVFVGSTEGKKVSVGMNVYVLPNSLSQYEYGYIRGKVISVSVYPASKESVYSYLGNMNLVDEFFTGGAPFMVKVKLEKNNQTTSGLAWTTKAGPPFQIEAGTTISVKIISRECAPLALLTKYNNW
jgi:hypothetical protein